MKHANNRRSRGRSNGKRYPNQKGGVFESNGPEVKVRGTPQQVQEKYLALARDAQSSGDRVQAEAYFQHAEHYLRVMTGDDDNERDPRRNGGQADHQVADSDSDEDEGDSRSHGKGNGGGQNEGGESRRARKGDNTPRDDGDGSEGDAGNGGGGGRGRGRGRGRRQAKNQDDGTSGDPGSQPQPDIASPRESGRQSRQDTAAG